MIYPETCRPAQIKINNLSERVDHSKKVAWRLALPKNCIIEFEDRRLGPQEENLNQAVGDFVLRRNDGLFTYQLAVVVDDALQGITHIVRARIYSAIPLDKSICNIYWAISTHNTCTYR